MKKIRVMTLVLILIIALTFGACGTTNDADTTNEDTDQSTTGDVTDAAGTDAADSSDTENSDEADDNTLVMATNAEFPPYEYYEGGEIVGIDAEIAALIANKLGMDLKIEHMEFESIITSVNTGKADMGMAGMTVTDERKEDVNFSTSYATGKQVIIVKEGSEIASSDDLEGKTIGVQLSTTGDLYVGWDYVDTGLASIERYNKGADAVQALILDKVDAVVIDNEPAKVFVSQNEGLTILETEYVTEEYAICVAKDNTELLEKIDNALAELTESGEIQAILDKYISAS